MCRKPITRKINVFTWPGRTSDYSVHAWTTDLLGCSGLFYPLWGVVSFNVYDCNTFASSFLQSLCVGSFCWFQKFAVWTAEAVAGAVLISLLDHCTSRLFCLLHLLHVHLFPSVSRAPTRWNVGASLSHFAVQNWTRASRRWLQNRGVSERFLLTDLHPVSEMKTLQRAVSNRKEFHNPARPSLSSPVEISLLVWIYSGSLGDEAGLPNRISQGVGLATVQRQMHVLSITLSLHSQSGFTGGVVLPFAFSPVVGSFLISLSFLFVERCDKLQLHVSLFVGLLCTYLRVRLNRCVHFLVCSQREVARSIVPAIRSNWTLRWQDSSDYASSAQVSSQFKCWGQSASAAWQAFL